MQIINVDLVPGKVMPILHASQFDKGRSLGVKLYNGGAVFELSGAEDLTAAVRKPDGNIVTETLTNAGGSLVEIITTEQMTACAGGSLCEIKIENAGDVIGTANFVLEVEKDPTDGGIASQSEINNLATQVADLVSEQYDSNNVIFDSVPTAGHGNGYTVTSEGIKDALDAINNPAASAVSYDNTASGLAATNVQDALDEVVDVVNDNFADAYDPTATYNTGDVCIYNNVLYICTADNTTGTFDPSKWTATTIDNIIGDLSALTTSVTSSLVGAVNEVDGKVSNILTNISALSNLSTRVYVGGNTSKTVTVTADSASRVGYVVFGQAAQGNLSPIFYLIGGYVTASRCSVTNISGKTGVTVDASSTTDLKFVFANATSVAVDLFFYPLFENTFTAS